MRVRKKTTSLLIGKVKAILALDSAELITRLTELLSEQGPLDQAQLEPDIHHLVLSGLYRELELAICTLKLILQVLQVLQVSPGRT